MFKPDQCDAINRFNCYFVMPFFTFHFTAGVDPYLMNYRFLAGDVVAKAICGVALALWANTWRSGNLSWAITSFSLSTMNNTLVVGVPLLKAMYGVVGEDLVVQSSVIQSLLWFPILLFLLEFRRTFWMNINNNNNNNIDDFSTSKNNVSSIEIVETNKEVHPQDKNNNGMVDERGLSSFSSSCSFGSTMKKVFLKLGKNPNAYACAIGLIWALVAKRWHFEMPSIVEGSILIMAKAGSGVAMFSIGLFMALQDKFIGCGVKLTLYGMLLRFVCGPLATAVGSLALGLSSNVLRIAIINAALPQAIASFVFAQEYGLHANVLSTACKGISNGGGLGLRSPGATPDPTPSPAWSSSMAGLRN
ncbi:hypothetical protein RD792_003700 [Penstemon davidsonii]|uniref:Auxin efflux carrier component n=1 Tax=Penstemon davidsonii TaxID=160366 RepID=A0ABR0DFF1_9LAMI|nr:hypothetical protein RD792_003700 [Penstemon davidsonii]